MTTFSNSYDSMISANVIFTRVAIRTYRMIHNHTGFELRSHIFKKTTKDKKIRHSLQFNEKEGRDYQNIFSGEHF